MKLKLNRNKNILNSRNKKKTNMLKALVKTILCNIISAEST